MAIKRGGEGRAGGGGGSKRGWGCFYSQVFLFFEEGIPPLP